MEKLILASQIRHPESAAQLDVLLGGVNGRKVAYIPTAGNGEGYLSWKKSTSFKWVQTLDTNLNIIELEDFRSSPIVEALKGNEIIWFGGGALGYLMYWIMRTELNLHIKQLLSNGMTYVGSSAGSIIAGQSLQIADWYPGEREPGASIYSGLGLVDFDIYPHYEHEHLEIIKKSYKGKRLHLLKNGESIIVENGVARVVGEQRFIEGDK